MIINLYGGITYTVICRVFPTRPARWARAGGSLEKQLIAQLIWQIKDRTRRLIGRTTKNDVKPSAHRAQPYYYTKKTILHGIINDLTAFNVCVECNRYGFSQPLALIVIYEYFLSGRPNSIIRFFQMLLLITNKSIYKQIR